MAAEPASAAEARFVDAIARRVVELLNGGGSAGVNAAEDSSGACLTVSQVAARYRVSRSWVYAHQRQLGAMRLGDGPRARLRFDPKAVAEGIAAFGRRDAPAEPPGKRARQRRPMRLIQFERLD
jgi:hypothetical protein